MTLSSADTAEVPRVHALLGSTPATTPRVRPPVVEPPAVEPPVVEVPVLVIQPPAIARPARRAARRERRRWAVLGLGVLAAVLGGTVAVLETVH